MRSRTRCASLGVVAMLLGSVVLAGRMSAQQGATEARQGQMSPTFRAATTLVEVDVIVRDKNRRFVADLRPEDFAVFEEGARQEISVVYRVVGPNEPSVAGAVAIDPAVPALPPPPPQQVQRLIVFFFDQAHIQPGGIDRAKKAAVAFLKTDFRQGDVGGVISGGTMVNRRLTGSREELESAVQSVAPSSEAGVIVRELRQWPRFVDLYEANRVVRNEPAYEPGASTVLQVVANRACRDQPDACGGGAGSTQAEMEVQNKAIRLVSQARLLAKQTMETISGLANGLGRLPGRKTLILLTEGFFVEDSWADLRTVVGRAARASLRIYAIDTRGLNRGSASSDIFTSVNPSQPELSAPAPGDTNADGPNSLAVDTGGFVIRNENDLAKAFTDIDRDTSSYYVIGFKSARPTDGKFHPIDVKVTRAGVSVRARKGYLAVPAGIAGSPSTVGDAAPGTPPAKDAAIAPIGGTVSAPPAPARPAVDATSGELPASPMATASVVTGGGGGAGEVPGAFRMRPRMREDVSALERERSGAARLLPDALKTLATAGWDAYQRGDVATARTNLLQATATSSAAPWMWYVLGWSQFALGEPVPAALSWETVRRAVPEFEPAYFDLADAYLRQREFGKAIDVLRVAEQRWPNDVEVFSALGVIRLARGAMDDAIRTFEQAVGINPNDANACYNLAKTYELRFVRRQRMRAAGADGTVPVGSALQDRDHAGDYYRRTILLGGPLVEAAREGLKRLGVSQ